ncbi:MAG TPA: helix-turn-helix transcriptional regulator [Casimicrobiaceae bacterium]|nr:helix-turn-helix transcriptional regulator [Casimicrobiaceae bacterium]
MAQTRALIAALKQVLKSRELTYADIARGLGMSEASVKRIFAKQTFTLRRLDAICELLGIEITDLGRVVEHESERLSRLTDKQEAQLVSDPKLLLVAVHALNHWTLDDIVATYAISKVECIRFLVRLDRLRIIDLLPDNRIRVRVARGFAWLPDGPIMRYFGAQVRSDFFASPFDGKGERLAFVSGMLSRTSNAVIQHHINRLSAEFAELHNQDGLLPLAERFGTSLLVAVRPWAPEVFRKLRRKPMEKAF